MIVNGRVTAEFGYCNQTHSLTFHEAAMMLAEVTRVLKLHPQFIHGLCPCNNQNVEQPERKVFTLPRARAHAHTHTHTHTQTHMHTCTLTHLPMCVLEMKRK